MTTKVEKRILVNVPISTAYNQWTQFEEFPRFMGGVKEVKQLDQKRLHWVAEIAGVKREWDAEILEQEADHKIAWAATGGATNAGSVHFEDIGGGQTSVSLSLEYEPEGLVEKIGDKLSIVEKQAEGDLERFKTFIEDAGYASGAWRESVNEGAGVTPGVEDALPSLGDKGKAGLSAKQVVAGVAAAAAGVAAVAASKSGDSKPEETKTEVSTTTVPTPAPVVEPVTTTPVVGAGTDDITTVDPVHTTPADGGDGPDDMPPTTRPIVR